LSVDSQAFALALTAFMRKLLVIMNSMLKHHAPWNPSLDEQHSR
jgi:transposase